MTLSELCDCIDFVEHNQTVFLHPTFIHKHLVVIGSDEMLVTCSDSDTKKMHSRYTYEIWLYNAAIVLTTSSFIISALV